MNKHTTHNRWEEKHAHELSGSALLKEEQRYREIYLEDTIEQITQFWKIKEGQVYLEIGCGPCFLGIELAKRFDIKLIGIDYSKSAIQAARKLARSRKIKGCTFFVADIEKLPLKNNSVDFIYGGGVIEHLTETQAVINELWRVLKIGGVSFNTVPWLNFGSLTYRQIWGNIPSLPVLRQVYEFIHIKMLAGKYLRFGYERSFLQSTMQKMHYISGFRFVKTGKFEVKLILEYIPKEIRIISEWIIKNVPGFWPMIYTAALK